MDVFTIISHLALTISCSISFYIYYGKYGAPNKGMYRRVSKLVSFFKPPNRKSISEDIHLPDLHTFEMNELQSKQDHKNSHQSLNLQDSELPHFKRNLSVSEWKFNPK